MKIFIVKKWSKNVCFCMLSLFFLCVSDVLAEDPINSAKVFFEDFVERGNNVDAEIIDYFADNARIYTVRHVGTDEPQRLVTAGFRHKILLRKALRQAQLRKMQTKKGSFFTDVLYSMEDECVRISALRHSEVRNTETYYSLLICQNDKGEWHIMEEINEIKE